MGEEDAYSVSSLTPELDYLRGTGLGRFDESHVPQLAEIARRLGHQRRGETAATAVFKLLETAAGLIDGKKLDSAVAHLFGLAPGGLGLPLKTRSKNAAAKHEVLPRQYSGSPGGKSHRRADIEFLAGRILYLLSEGTPEPGPIPVVPPIGPRVFDTSTPKSVARYLDQQSGVDWIVDRERTSNELWQALETEREAQIGLMGEPSPKVCIFASGSFARREGMEYSDLDLFLVDDALGKDKLLAGPLTHFERAQALTFIDRCRQARGIQRFSQGGHFQQTQSMKRLLEDGARRDESSNLMMTRTLLLSGSRPFYNDRFYEELRSSVFEFYWHVGGQTSQRPFRPAHLFNDLRRVWLTMLTNFEQFYPKDVVKNSARRVSTPERHVALLKLLTAQQLGCYTPILGMLHRSGPDGLLRQDAQDVLNMTTSQRLDDLAASSNEFVAQCATAVREIYGQYLGFSWCSFHEMSDRIEPPEWDEIKRYFDQVPDLILLLLQEFARQNPKLAKFALA